MRIRFDKPEHIDHSAFHAFLMPQLSASGFVGATCIGKDLFLEFPDATFVDEAAVTKIVSGFVFKPSWDLVKAKREPMLTMTDFKINKILDNGGDATAWRKYRQALRDVTKQADPLNVVWPTVPTV
jgi:hypothetical protein